MIIIEGMDGCGKTTAAKRIAEITGLEYRHMGPPPKDFDHVNSYVDLIGPCVQDRFHAGEHVYGRLGMSKVGTAVQQGIVISELEKRGAFVVCMYAGDIRWLQERLKDSDQLYDSEQQVLAANGWEDLARTSLLGERMFDVVWDSSLGFPIDANLQDWIERALNKWNG